MQLNPKDPVATPIVARRDELLPSTPRLVTKESTLRGAMLCVRKGHISWTRSGSRSKRHTPVHCPPVCRPRPAITHSRSGGN